MLSENDDQQKQEKFSTFTINNSLPFASFAIRDSDFLIYISCFNLILSEFQINSNFKSISFCHSQVSLVSIAVFPKRLNCVQNF